MLEWSAVSRPAGSGLGGDRFCAFHTEAGLVVALADGAGNSRGGASAAEALIRAVVSAATCFRSALNEWDLQDLLFGVDETLALGGEETTGVIAVFGQGEIIAAAAGDTVLIVGMEDGGLVRFPEPRTDCRLGSGRADVRVLRMPTRLPALLVTDGAGACLRYEELRRRVVAGVGASELASWATHLVNERIVQVGDDATMIAVAAVA